MAVPVSTPAVESIRSCTAAPAASPPGKMRLMALPARPAVTTANQHRVPSASRWRAKAQVKEATSAPTATANQIGFSVDSRGQEARTLVMLGTTT